jgi:hypothetical protein
VSVCPGLADPPRLDVERPVQRVADDPDEAIGLRLDHRERPGAEARHAEHGDVVPGVEGDGLGGEALVGNRIDHRRAALAGDDVRGRHDNAWRRDPAAARDPEPARGAEDAARRSPPRLARLRRGRSAGWARPGSAGRRSTGNGSHGASAFSRPLRRDDRVQPLQHLGALDVLAQRALAGEQERSRAHDPDKRHPRSRAEDETPCTIERTERREAHRRPEERARPSSRAPRARPRRSPRREGDERRVRRMRPPLSTTGASRAPITAPTTMPVIASRLATSPFRSPTKPPSATTASAIQSSRPTLAG